MVTVGPNRKDIFLKIIAIAICTSIIIPSNMIVDMVGMTNPKEEPETNTVNNNDSGELPEVSSVLTEDGIWINVDGSNPGTTVDAFVAVSDTSGITVVADFNGFWRGSSGSIDMPGTSTIHEVGKPKLPRLIEYLEIPYDVNITLDVTYGVPVLLSGYTIQPAQEPVAPIWNITEDDSLTYDETVYLSEAYFPSYNVSMEGESRISPIIMRGRRLLELSFYPIQYSPSTGDIIFYPKFVVKVRYDEAAQIEPVEARLWSEPFERLFEAFLLNYNPWDPESGTGPGSEPTFICPSIIASLAIPVLADYLIITDSTFKPYADRLAAWKTQKGLLAEVVTTTEIQVAYPFLNLEEGIKQLIQDAYDTWTIGPSYVLLFGDCEFVPNGYGIAHKATTKAQSKYEYIEDRLVPGSSPARYYLYDQESGRIGTDSIYFTVHGDDYIPDIIYGRISVDTTTEAETVVNKILAYEKSPPSNPDFYNNILTSAHFQFYDPEGEEPENEPPNLKEESGGYQFVKYAEDIRLYLKELGYTTHLNYSTNSSKGFPERFYGETAAIDFTGSIYDHLDHIDWIEAVTSFGAGNITLNFNSDEGRLLVIYNDHGASRNMVYPFRIPRSEDPNSEWIRSNFEGWYALGFNVTHIPDLENDDQLPLVISSACNAGWFDGEIDETVLGSLYESDDEIECFSENITRMEGGGAIAAIGASRISWTLISGDMVNGIIQAFWPGHLSLGNQPIYGMGAALLLGKINAASIWGYDDSYQFTKTTFQEYHLFGDPETQLWTESPSTLTVSYPTQMSTDASQEFVVTVLNETEPVYFAKVCIQGEDVYEIGYTNSYGQVLFDIETTSTLPVNVTVTKHNFIPHLESIEVIDCIANLEVDPAQALAGDSVTVILTDFDGGETIHVYYNDTELVLVGDSIVIPNGRNGFANIKANDTDEVAIFLFKRYQGGPPVDPYVYSQNDRSTWYLADGRLTYDNPSIEIYEGEDFKNSRELIQLHNYDVHVNVTNNLNQAVSNVEVTLAWAMFSVGRDWHLINDEPVIIPVVPALGSAEAIIPWVPSITGHICLNATIFHINDENEVNNFGQENTDVAELQSPGESWFLVANPTDKTSYVYLEVRQQCTLTDIWRAEIVGFSYLALPSGGYENISLQITSPLGVPGGEARLFTVSLYINGEYIGGVSIKGVQSVVSTTTTTTTTTITTTTTTAGTLDSLWALVGAAAGAAVIVIVTFIIMKKKRST